MSDDVAREKPGLLTADLAARRIGRRAFLEGAIALGVTASAASALWSGGVAAATPRKGGRFRVALDDANTTDSLDPATYASRFMITLVHTHRNFLTEITPDNRVAGELAESWDVTPDATKWTLKLRQGVEFHSGKTFDAHDAAASLNYHRGEESKSAAKSLLASVESITVEDKHTLTVQLSGGNADFPYLLTDYHLAMLPADADGTGGYVLQDFDPGVRATMTRFPNYWKADRAHFGEVEYLAVPDVHARQTALMSDAVDAMIECDLKTVSLLEQTPDVKVDEVPSGTHNTLPMHMDVAPFTDNDVRLALKHSIDRNATIEKILNGHGSIGNDHPISPIMPFFDGSIGQRQYDPDKARFHLKKAGMERLSVALSVSDAPGPGGVDLAVLFKESASKSGIDLAVERMPNDGYWSDVWLKKPFCLSGWGQRPTPDIIFTLGYASKGDWNESHFEHDRFNKLLVEARAQLDEKKRAEMYSEMQRILHDEGSVIIPFFRNWVYARRATVAHGDQLTASWPLDGARGAERWWFA
jgi:peptide/nickel transport system substrate-binding protein